MKYISSLLAVFAMTCSASAARADSCPVMSNYILNKVMNELWVLSVNGFEVTRVNVWDDIYGGHGNATACNEIVSSDNSFMNRAGRENDMLIGFGIGKNPRKAVELAYFPHNGFGMSSDGPDRYVIRRGSHFIRVCWLKDENTWAHNADPSKDGPCVVKSNSIPDW